MSQVTNWSLDPLLHGNLPTTVLESIFENITFVREFYIMILVLSVMYPIVHKVLLYNFERYRDIKTHGKQIVVLHHAVEALILSLSLPFFTYYKRFNSYNDSFVLCLFTFVLCLFTLFFATDGDNSPVASIFLVSCGTVFQ